MKYRSETKNDCCVSEFIYRIESYMIFSVQWKMIENLDKVSCE